MRTEMLLPNVWNEANLNDKYKLIAETDKSQTFADLKTILSLELMFSLASSESRKRSLVDFHPASCGFSADLMERKRLLISTSTGMSATTRSTKTNTTTK